VEREFRPKLIKGIGRWTLFPGTFIIGNAELDRYIRVPAESVEPVWRAILYCDGNRTLAEIGCLVEADGWKLEVAALYQKLADAGLVAGAKYVSDIDRVSVAWLEARVGGLLPVWRGWQRLTQVLAVAMLFCLVTAAGLWLVAPGRPAGQWNPSRVQLVVAMTSGVLVSILVHEAGHAVAACAEGLRPERLRLLGYMGVIPYIMLQIPGLYTIRPAGRLRVWLAGPLASLFLASFCYIGSCFESLPLAARVWLDRMSIVNAMIAVWNCCPLLPTDGYFIACTLLKQANWRIRSWRELAGCLRQRRRPQMLLLLYGLGSSILLALMTLHSMGRILEVTSFSWFGYTAVLLLILMLGFKPVALKRQKAVAQMGGM
jgi:hypothetical protein